MLSVPRYVAHFEYRYMLTKVDEGPKVEGVTVLSGIKRIALSVNPEVSRVALRRVASRRAESSRVQSSLVEFSRV